MSSKYDVSSYPLLVSTAEVSLMLALDRFEVEPLLERLGIQPVITTFNRARLTAQGKKIFKKWSRDEIVNRIANFSSPDNSGSKIDICEGRRAFRQPEMKALSRR